MKDAATITKLFNEQNKEFIDEIINKHSKMFINLGNYIKERNFKHIPYESNDFQSILFKSIQLMKNVKQEMVEKFDYLLILKKIFIQQVIALGRFYKSNKQKILSFASNEQEYFDNIRHWSCDDVNGFNKRYDLLNVYKKILMRIKKDEDKKIFNLYLLNVKPQKIAEMLNQSSKQIYNSLFMIKNICSEYKTF